ncbi:MAG TPA: 3-hydroxyacyl-CoA dehydrogenase family protein, partial [Thermoleophilaceae bacterium]|nr:3-hydroxyacyl-CoA dehydrogenase family protein [Thermoleophilaceae bacterium]
LHRMDPGAAGLHLLPPLAPGGVIELTTTADTPPETLARARELAAALGQHAELVGDAPGLVLGRIACQLVNEAAFLIGEGNGTAEDVDAGLELGVNHPRGPVAWSDDIGLAHVTTVLGALRRERGEAYRTAPLLAQRAALGAGLAG